jgi:hypothetical protein
MMLLDALVSVVTPIIIFLVPGLAWIPAAYKEPSTSLWARIGLTSIVFNILASLLAAIFGIPQIFIIPASLIVAIGALAWQRQRLRKITTWYRIMGPPVVILMLVLAFAIPFVIFHDGLPTGDIQKSIIWANDVVETHHLPNYDRAVADYNRDPVDFYTPGLHTLLASTLRPAEAAAGGSSRIICHSVCRGGGRHRHGSSPATFPCAASLADGKHDWHPHFNEPTVAAVSAGTWLPCPKQRGRVSFIWLSFFIDRPGSEMGLDERSARRVNRGRVGRYPPV